MSALIDHIGDLELELAQMTADGHHADPAVDAAMRDLDEALSRLHRANRERIILEGQQTP